MSGRMMASVWYQVAQHLIDQIYLHTRCPCPSLPMQDLEGAGMPMSPPKSPTPCSERQLKRVGSEWLPKPERSPECMKCNPPHHDVSICSPECESPTVWHPGTQFVLDQRQWMWKKTCLEFLPWPGIELVISPLRGNCATHYTTGPHWHH